ncbi:hypothetical protein BleG1_0558 [Shouchella lehensis G1]|uniref:Uncharacterized protein n=2 Tax=Shouchella lehensis TaxID=300825 RepID=A0A060LPC7_9BACI|nr:hypothetical protein BleG1_0558 [Shouchella lehensis G1]
MKMSATIATGQVKNSLARGMDNLQTNLNGSTPALAPAGEPVNHVPYNAMNSRRIQQDVGAVKQEQLRKIEVVSGVKPRSSYKERLVQTPLNNGTWTGPRG